LGSGSTLIAAEKTGRVCRGVELDPLYVDVIICRYEAQTGRTGILVETGETFAELASRRAREGDDNVEVRPEPLSLRASGGHDAGSPSIGATGAQDAVNG
jgi:hypothetical protein